MRNALDLRTNARLSLRFLESAADKERQYLPYFWINFLPDPPEFSHEMAFDDTENFGRWLYAIACAQRVSGCDDCEDVKQEMLGEIDQRIAGPYGFVYSTDYAAERNGRAPYTWLWGDRSFLEGWIQCWRSATKQEQRDYFASRIENMIDGIEAFSVRIGECLFFPTYEPPLDWKTPDNMQAPTTANKAAWEQFYSDDKKTQKNVLPLPADSLGGVIWPMVEWYELSGNSKALQLAIGIANTIVKYQSLRSNPICPIGCFSNNHGVLNAIAGVLACSRHERNNQHLIWATTLFDYYLSRCSSSFGWVMENERVRADHVNERDSAEGCAVVDMVRVGIELARVGFSYGWDVAERFTRNYLTQSQISSSQPFSLPPDLIINHDGRGAVTKVPAEHRDNENIFERSIGAMAGWGAPNDILAPHGRLAMCVQNCCSAHLPIGLMHAWENAVSYDGTTISINLLITSDGDYAKTIDYQPQKGVLEIFPKRNADMRIRIPDWVDDNKVEVQVNEEPIQSLQWSRDRFISIAKISAEDKISLSYPLREISITERLGGEQYTTEWRGDTVVGISPQGRFIPIF